VRPTGHSLGGLTAKPEYFLPGAWWASDEHSSVGALRIKAHQLKSASAGLRFRMWQAVRRVGQIAHQG
jgi:hypothetical protein